MESEALWFNDSIRMGEDLRAAYLARLGSEGLHALAAEAYKAKGEPGGASAEETDKHFAWRFSNSAGRSIYACIDPLAKLGNLSEVLCGSLLDGEITIVDVPCGGGAGALGLISAIYEQRKAALLPTLPINVTLIAGDYSPRAREHLRAMVESLKGQLDAQGIQLNIEDHHWDASDARSCAAFTDVVIEKASSSDRVMLMVSNFSSALEDAELNKHFEFFLSQFASRIDVFPNLLCWVEPNTKSAMKLLPKFDSWISRFLGWFKKSEKGRVFRTDYKMCDPLTGKVYSSGVVVLKCTTEGMPW